jgi:putative membrane protein
MNANESKMKSALPAVLAILVISAIATLFLFWLIYVHPASSQSSARFAFLPPLNAFLNSLSATALLIGIVMIRAKRIAGHRMAMSAAFLFSTLFLAGYILHHALHGDVRYPAHAAFRALYLSLLASHILLATVALPIVLATFFFSLSGRIPQHKKIAHWTFPLWLYVSVTGVITYVMLRIAS